MGVMIFYLVFFCLLLLLIDIVYGIIDLWICLNGNGDQLMVENLSSIDIKFGDFELLDK